MSALPCWSGFLVVCDAPLGPKTELTLRGPKEVLKTPLRGRLTGSETEDHLMISILAFAHEGADNVPFRSFVDTQERGSRSCGMSAPEYRRSEMENVTSCLCPLQRHSLRFMSACATNSCNKRAPGRRCRWENSVALQQVLHVSGRWNSASWASELVPLGEYSLRSCIIHCSSLRIMIPPSWVCTALMSTRCGDGRLVENPAGIPQRNAVPSCV